MHDVQQAYQAYLPTFIMTAGLGGPTSVILSRYFTTDVLSTVQAVSYILLPGPTGEISYILRAEQACQAYLPK